MGNPSTSVVVPMYNAGKVIGDLLKSLASQDFLGSWEVIVADNGSRDNSRDRVRDWQNQLPDLRLIDASECRGPSHARNRGAQEARGELLAYIDADDVALPQWVRAITATLQDYDLATGPFDLDTLNQPSAVVWYAPDRPADRPPTRFDFMPAVMGGNFGIRTRVLERLGGWSEDYFYAEDVELSWRAQLNGSQIGFNPDAVVMFRMRSDLKSLARQQYYRAYHGHHLTRDFAQYGLKPPSDKSRMLEGVKGLIVNLPLLPFSLERRGLWVKNAAHALGWSRRKLEARLGAKR